MNTAISMPVALEQRGEVAGADEIKTEFGADRRQCRRQFADICRGDQPGDERNGHDAPPRLAVSTDIGLSHGRHPLVRRRGKFLHHARLAHGRRCVAAAPGKARHAIGDYSADCGDISMLDGGEGA